MSLLPLPPQSAPAPPPAGPAPSQPPRPNQNRRRGSRVRHELSAGGVALRQENDEWLVALLKTEHKRGAVWVLPKGHVELHTGENISEAARREVEEEAGLRDLSVKDQLGVTRFSFQAEDAVVKKTVHYFLMITQQKKLVPQAEEGMIDAQWFSFDEAVKNLEYDTDQDMVLKAREKITGQPAPRRAASTGRRHSGTSKFVRRSSSAGGLANSAGRFTRRAGRPASSAGKRTPRIHH